VMDTERKRRIGLNEAVFREVNERLGEISERFGLEQLDLICECGEVACADRIAITVEEYEHVRSQPHWFAIVPGHEIDDVETVVEKHDSYVVVQKHPGAPTQVAEETDPRS